jgi:hypothetical protein
MILLRNWLVQPGFPEVHAFGIVVCHPDDHEQLSQQGEMFKQLREQLGVQIDFGTDD